MTTSRAPDIAAVESVIVGFLTEELGWDGDPQSLRGPGCARLTEVLDSQDLLELAGVVEDLYEVEISDQEINADFFGTLSDLAAFVVAKVRAHGAA